MNAHRLGFLLAALLPIGFLTSCGGESAEEASPAPGAEQPADAAVAPNAEPGAPASGETLPVTLEAVNESGVEGRATKIHVADSVQLSLMVQGLPREGEYAAHIHRGTCVTGGEVLVPLSSVVATSDGMGRSLTTLAAARLPTGPHFVQVHGASGVLACGDGHEG